jgi:chemotaxis methyl-accepting protein methylase
MTPPDPRPSLYRVYAGGHSGTTAFFRNRPFLGTLTALLAEDDAPLVRVFVHACSVGAEPYSLAMWSLHRAWPLAPRRVEIVASDIEPAFLETARRGVYPNEVLDPLTDEERTCVFARVSRHRSGAITRAEFQSRFLWHLGARYPSRVHPAADAERQG